MREIECAGRAFIWNAGAFCGDAYASDACVFSSTAQSVIDCGLAWCICGEMCSAKVLGYCATEEDRTHQTTTDAKTKDIHTKHQIATHKMQKRKRKRRIRLAQQVRHERTLARIVASKEPNVCWWSFCFFGCALPCARLEHSHRSRCVAWLRRAPAARFAAAGRRRCRSACDGSTGDESVSVCVCVCMMMAMRACGERGHQP